MIEEDLGDDKPQTYEQFCVNNNIYQIPFN